MTRKSATAVAVSREPEGRQPLWEEMVKFKGQPFIVNDIFEATYVNRRTISSYLTCLCAGGYAERFKGEDDLFNYRIIADPVPYHAPRLNKQGKPVKQGGGVENMWRTMRMLSQFSPRDVAAHATTDIVNVSDWAAKSYCSMLLRTGFLKVVTKATNGKSQAVYRLIRNTGPNPPMIQRTKQVFDPNTKTAYPVGGAS